MINILLSPLSYLTIKNLPHKTKVDWFYPLLLSFLTCVFLYVLQFISHKFVIQIDGIFFQTDLAEKLIGLLQTLPGFYLAALAAVATFNNQKLDTLMTNDPTPTAERNYSGVFQHIALTRRIYLSLMFSYLTFSSLMLLILIVLVKYTFTIEITEVSRLVIYAASVIGTFVFFLFFYQLIVVTCLGLSYLGDKMHEA